MTDARPNVHRRRLGLELRALRNMAGMSLTVAADRLGVAGKTALSKIENGKQRVPLIALAGFFEVYGLTDDGRKTKIRSLASLASSGKRANLLDQYRGDVSDPFAEYLHLEELANKIEAYNWVVHGLLQTRAYAKTLMSCGRRWESDREIDRWVDLRMDRQHALTRDEPLHMQCILDEAALVRPIGTPAVMKEQLERLLEVAEEHSHVDIRVLPFAVGAHAGLDGLFSLLHFPAGSPVVVVEPMTTSLYLEEDRDIGRYETAFDNLRSQTLDAEDTARRIHSLIKECYS